MKRRIFFWLERLKITPAERRAVSALIILLVILKSLNAALSPHLPFEEGHYLELEKQFKKRTALLEAEENKLMKRYFPGDRELSYAASADTLPADTLSGQQPGKLYQQPEKGQIDINSASHNVLISLPGIGPVYARRIIEYRRKNDGFKSIDELKKIRGIAEKRLDKLKPFVKLTDSK